VLCKERWTITLCLHGHSVGHITSELFFCWRWRWGPISCRQVRTWRLDRDIYSLSGCRQLSQPIHSRRLKGTSRCLGRVDEMLMNLCRAGAASCATCSTSQHITLSAQQRVRQLSKHLCCCIESTCDQESRAIRRHPGRRKMRHGNPREGQI